MIVPSGAVRVLVATQPMDFRKGMDGIAALVRERLVERSVQRGDPCIPQQAGRSAEAAAVGRQRRRAAEQAARAGLVPLAVGG